LITAIVLPLLLPAFSRLQNNIPELKSTILKYQKYLSVLLLPLGTGIFVFSHLITEIMLGSQWTEAEPMIGLWAIVDVFVVIFARFCGNVYPAIGKPRIAAVVQMIYLLVLVPVVYYFAQKGFTELYWARSMVKFFMVLIHFVFIYFLIKQSPWVMIKNVFPEMFSCLVMAIVGTLLLRINGNVVWSLVWIGICIMVYFSVLYIFPKDRKILWSMVSHFQKHFLRKHKKV
jgi:PST family polysaccharide transporter